MMAAPSWIDGLNRVGEYYEGFVKNIDDLLAKHSAELVTMYGIRCSRKIGTTSVSDKENHDHDSSVSSYTAYSLRNTD